MQFVKKLRPYVVFTILPRKHGALALSIRIFKQNYLNRSPYTTLKSCFIALHKLNKQNRWLLQ